MGSMTSPTNWQLNGMSKSAPFTSSVSPDSSIATPNGGAAVMITPKKIEAQEFGRNAIPKMYSQTVDPSQLFGLISEYTDYDSGSKNYSKDPMQSPIYPSRSHIIKKIAPKKIKRKSGAYTGSSGLPLYVTHKKRKSRSRAKTKTKRTKKVTLPDENPNLQQMKSW